MKDPMTFWSDKELLLYCNMIENSLIENRSLTCPGLEKSEIQHTQAKHQHLHLPPF